MQQIYSRLLIALKNFDRLDSVCNYVSAETSNVCDGPVGMNWYTAILLGEVVSEKHPSAFDLKSVPLLKVLESTLVRPVSAALLIHSQFITSDLKYRLAKYRFIRRYLQGKLKSVDLKATVLKVLVMALDAIDIAEAATIPEILALNSQIVDLDIFDTAELVHIPEIALATSGYSIIYFLIKSNHLGPFRHSFRWRIGLLISSTRK